LFYLFCGSFAEFELAGKHSIGSHLDLPRRPLHDLAEHDCIALRLPTSGGLWSSPFVKNGRELNVRPKEQMAFNTIALHLDTALAELGLAFLPEDVVKDDLAKGQLVRLLADWSARMSGYNFIATVLAGPHQ
jgi:DNA-binding transcriptional LysR family regulator